MFILKKGHQPGVYVPLRALFLVLIQNIKHLAIFCGCTAWFVFDLFVYDLTDRWVFSGRAQLGIYHSVHLHS